jgi:hypothetical protein
MTVKAYLFSCLSNPISWADHSVAFETFGAKKSGKEILFVRKIRLEKIDH